MKFAHLADTHLGFRQYGNYQREKDLYELFGKIIDKIIEEDVDFVIHSGDLFDSAKPAPNALLAFQKGLLKLKGAGIPMYAIAGNHESLMVKEAIPPQVLFKKFNLKVISPINTNYVFNNVFIAGLPYYPSSQNKVLKEKIAELSAKAEEYDKAILVLHQGIDKYLPFQYELEIGDIPDNFDYYAFGHVHSYIEDDFGKGSLVYPGSADILKADEAENYNKNGKGFVVVDLDGQKPNVKRVTVDIPREFVFKRIDYANLGSQLEAFKNLLIKDYDTNPIVNLTVYNVDGDIKKVYDFINTELEKYAFMIRTTCETIENSVDFDIVENDSLGPAELISEQLEGFDNEDMTKFAIDLFNALSKDLDEESGNLISSYFEQNFDSLEIDEVEKDNDDNDDNQITLREAI